MNTTIPKNKIEIFFLGFYIFAFGTSLISMPSFPIPLSRLIQLLGLSLIIILFSVKSNYKSLNIYARAIFLLFTLYQILIIFRDNNFSLWNLQRYIFTPGYLLYLAPIIVYKISDLRYVKQIFRLVVLLSKTFILIIIPFLTFVLSGTGEGLNIYESFHAIFGTGAIWGILMQEYLTKEQKRWVFIAVSLIILLALILARRSILLIYLITLLVYFSYKLVYKQKTIKRRFLFFFSFLLTALVVFFLFQIYGPVLFPTLFERMMDDTRSIVELSLLADLEPGSFDFIWGRGISGNYYCPFVESNGLDYREHIESGYFEFILKGGVALIILYCFFVFPAIFLGLFRSNNNFCKLASIYCILFSGFLYGVGSFYTFGIRYILFLFCIFICYKKEIRMLNNHDLFKIINSK